MNLKFSEKFTLLFYNLRNLLFRVTSESIYTRFRYLSRNNHVKSSKET